MHSTRYFKRRTYTFSRFVKDTFRLFRKRTNIREAMRSGRVSEQLREKIMLVVTVVNGCIYCKWGHTKLALEKGCTEEEIENIMIHDFNSCDSSEVVALAFAQHYAETKGNYSKEAYDRLVEVYGMEKALDILIIIEMITIGNLLGNTFDAFESRFKGKPPEQGSFFFELIVYILGFPFLKILRRKIKRKRD
ncbi:MAG: carboxymuconolactone decarboxylase family protein [Candidatus Heimdallarchaeaceae archaeon]